MLFLTVLAVIGLIAGLVVGIIGAVELGHVLDATTTSTDPSSYYP